MDRRAAREQGRTAARWPALGLGTIAVIAPQLLGGATRLTELAILVLALLACAWTVALARRLPPSGQLPSLAVVAAASSVWSALQVVPLPCSWLTWSQPERHAVAEQLSSLGAIDHERCQISAAPGATVTSVALGLALVTLFVCACSLARLGAREILLRSIALSAITMAVVALSHWVLGVEDVFGIYAPQTVTPRLLVAPLLNENHLAGLMVLGWPTCLSRAFKSRRLDAAIAWSTGALLVFATGLLSLSRGGAVALVAGGLAYVAFHATRRRTSVQRWVWIASVVVLCLAAGGLVAAGRVATEFRAGATTRSKLELAWGLLELLPEHPWTGLGRRALGDVSGRVLAENLRVLYAESFPIQWLVEWGIPCALALTLAIVVFAVQVCRRGMRRSDAALVCGLGALLAQNLVDFSLEFAGVATTAAVAAGVLAARCEPFERLDVVSLDRSLRPLLALQALALALALPFFTFESRDHLADQLTSLLRTEPRAVAAALPGAFRWYPLDPVFMLFGAEGALKTGDRTAGRWLNLTMQQTPGWEGPHLLAAQALEQRGAVSQAAIELAIALRERSGDSFQLACNFLKRHPRGDLAVQLGGEAGLGRRLLLEELTSCLLVHVQPIQGELLAQAIVDEYPRSTIGHEQLVRAAQIRGERALAVERAKRMVAALPDDPASVATLGEALIADGAPEQALQLVDRTPPPLRTSLRVLQAEAHAASELKQTERFSAAVEQMLALHGHNSDERAAIHRAASLSLSGQGEPYAALAHAQSAYDLTNEPADLERVHETAVKAGVVAIALRTASELCQLRHRVETYCGSALPALP